MVTPPHSEANSWWGACEFVFLAPIRPSSAVQKRSSFTWKIRFEVVVFYCSFKKNPHQIHFRAEKHVNLMFSSWVEGWVSFTHTGWIIANKSRPCFREIHELAMHMSPVESETEMFAKFLLSAATERADSQVKDALFLSLLVASGLCVVCVTQQKMWIKHDLKCLHPTVEHHLRAEKLRRPGTAAAARRRDSSNGFTVDELPVSDIQTAVWLVKN